jgi:hypothetical protein
MLISINLLRNLRLLHFYCWLLRLNYLVLILSELLKKLGLEINLVLLLLQLPFLLFYKHLLLISLVVKETFWRGRYGSYPGVGRVLCVERIFGLFEMQWVLNS